MTTDRELLELAAKAAGIEYDFICPTGAHCGDAFALKDYFWNPLADDGDALRLAVTCKLSELPITSSWESFIYPIVASPLPDPNEQTRRAIVRAAAEIGKAMLDPK